jgi:hypothetical protein
MGPIDDVIAAAERLAEAHADCMQMLTQNRAWKFEEAEKTLRAAILVYGAAQRERCATLCGHESVTLATRDQTRGALHCMNSIRALGDE